ncbi:4-hydroxybenzoyl-CoA thioesterase [Sphingomonas vulcanisoli]|uniref:4-hydroxybenzoyl-CoA thioesterase n=1 Tax=Sphingomonas vulcanisoli TaxID=1658060 RepID=A0ABX0TUQ6_9SPHN|nr:thioesterase family protein [Sphingomonas vulcanisoli]NIJ09262.1 4-hydroxybenzoyl-CoA thioesterase [Sphingomonas vulcanisoli]
MFAHVHSHVIEWGECDPAGIVFFPRFLEMFDVATAFMFEAATGMSRAKLVSHYGILGWPIVSCQVDFRATARFDDRVTIHSEIRRLGRTSIEIAQVIRRDDIVCVETTGTRIWAKYGEEGAVVPEPLPAELRHQLSKGNEA